jgi:hypothetical protein
MNGSAKKKAANGKPIAGRIKRPTAPTRRSVRNGEACDRADQEIPKCLRFGRRPMPQDENFGPQPPSRLEAVAQHVNEQEADCNHSTIMV